MYREMLDARVIALSVGMAVVATLIVAVLGPVVIGTQLGLFDRLAIVAVCGAICWPICHALSAAVMFVMRARRPFAVLLGWATGALFVSMPCSAVAYAVHGIFGNENVTADVLPAMVLNAAVIMLPVSFLVHYVAYLRVKLKLVDHGGQTGAGQPMSSNVDAGGDQAPIPTPLGSRSELLDRFFDRLPDTVGTDIVYLSVSGHYIDVVTAGGSCLVLMRFADAVAILGDLGIRVHRSHWVAYRHIVGSVRRDGRMFVRVTGSHEIPVSRSYMQKVRSVILTLRDGDHAT